MKICIQTGGYVKRYGPKIGLEKLKEAGFSCLDFGLDGERTGFSPAILKDHLNEGLCIYEKSLEEIMEFWRPFTDEISRQGFEIYQIHAPFPAYKPDFPELLDYSIEVYKKVILYCHRVGCKRLVIHGISHMRTDTTHTQEDINRLNDHLYTSLIDTLKQTDVTVCLENLFTSFSTNIYQGTCADPADAIQMIDRYNRLAGKECFGICVDTGHLNLLGIDQYQYITRLGNRVKAFHIHDNCGSVDQHLAPYTGNIDWDSFCKAVHDIGYDGALNFETFRQVCDKVVPDLKTADLYIQLIAGIGKRFIERIQNEFE